MLSRTGKILTVICVIAALSSPAAANTDLPDGEMHTLQGRVLRCFDLEQFKSIVIITEERRAADKRALLLADQVAVLLDASVHLNGQVTDLEAIRDSLQVETVRLRDMWKEENRLRHIAENNPRFGSWIPWVTTAILATTSVTLGLVVVIRR